MLRNIAYSCVFIVASIYCMQTPNHINNHTHDNNIAPDVYEPNMQQYTHNYRGHKVLWGAAVTFFVLAESADRLMPQEPNICPTNPPISAWLRAAVGGSLAISGIFGMAEYCAHKCTDCTIL